MKRIRLIALTFCLASFCTAYSAAYFACPKSYQYVYLGATIDQTKQVCGPPDSSKQVKNTDYKTIEETQWIYHYRQASTEPGGTLATNLPHYHKDLLVVNLNKNNIVESITVAGNNHHATNFCDPTLPIVVGKSTNLQVRQLCGQPSIIHTIKKKLPPPSQYKIIWTYQAQPYLRPIQLIFENNKLVKISP